MDSEIINNNNVEGKQIVMLQNIWDLYIKCKDDNDEFIDEAKCKVCKKTLKTTGGNTSTLHSHGKIHKYEAPKRERKRKNTGEISGTFSTCVYNINLNFIYFYEIRKECHHL